MNVRFLGFGALEIDGRRYDHDVVIHRGAVTRRRKGPSKGLRGRYGHTPLTAAESIPWDCRRLIVGTGADGALPIDAGVRREADRRGVTLVAVPTEDACDLVSASDTDETAAILHVTC